MIMLQQFIPISIWIGLVEATFRILQPKSFSVSSSDIQYSLSNFGQIPYGKTQSGQIVLYQDDDRFYDLCSDVKQESIQQEFNPNQFTWFIVKRGNCSFTSKVRNAQSVGASLVIIVDNQTRTAATHIKMLDDGHGLQVHIPSIFISKADGERIINQILSHKEMVVGFIAFNDTLKAEKVLQIINYLKPEVLFGLDLENRESFKLVRKFEKYYLKVKDQMTLKVFYEFNTCMQCSADNFGQSNKDCLGGGRYCCLDPIAYGKGTGQDVAREQLRQICLFTVDQAQWWKYLNNFDKNCLHPLDYSECFKKQINNEKLFKKVEECVLTSYQKDEKKTEDQQLNTILEEQLFYRGSSGISYFPGASINNITYRGNINAYNIFLDVCSSMITPPRACEEELTENLIQVKKGSNMKLLILIMVIIFVFMLFMVFIYRRMMRKEMSKQVNEQVAQIVTQYIQFSEQKNSN